MLKMSHDQNSKFVNNHVVVIGGGIAGLLASRVLSDHFEKVTLIERDSSSETDEFRKGVPQSKQSHFLLKRGEEIISELFPGIIDEMVADGALLIDSSEIDWFHYGVWKAKYSCGIVYCLQSRSHLEQHIYRRLALYSNISRLNNSKVIGLTLSPNRQRITGVRISVGESEQSQKILDADLVVDASGQSSQTHIWLKRLGYSAPPETRLQVNTIYNARIYIPLPEYQSAWKPTLVYCQPPSKQRVGSILPLEGGKRWIVSLIGNGQDGALKRDEDFLKFAKNLEVAKIFEIIQLGQPITPITSYKFRSNIRRHYEQLSTLPQGLIVVGDALCQLNPIYGQGMTMAALEMMVLDQCLREYKSCQGKFSRYFFETVSSHINAFFDLTMSEDIASLAMSQPLSIMMSFLKRYKQQIGKLCATDPLILKRSIKVSNMMEKPYTLLYPDVMSRVLVDSLRG